MSPLPQKKRGRPPQLYAEYRRVADDLRTRFAAGEWPPGSALPSLRILARSYKVSFDTCRAAMNVMRQEDRVSISGLRRLTVTPLMAVKPAIEPKRAILLVITSPLRTHPQHSDGNQLLLGMLQGAADLDAPLIVTQSYTLRSSPPQGFLQLSPRGILIWGTMEPEGYAEFEKLPQSVVMVDHPVERHSLHSVCVDNEQATREAVRRLVGLGHRKIAFLRRVSLSERDVDPDSRERQAAYRIALKEHGIPYQRRFVFSVLNQDTSDSPAFRTILETKAKITAVICADPVVAQHLMKAISKLGRIIPRDLSIVCYQGAASNEHLAGPVIDFFELGRKAVRCADFARRPAQCVRVPCLWRETNSMGLA